MKLETRSRTLSFPRRPMVVGIVNVNDDSFSGDGTLDTGEALAQTRRMVAEGADVIDVGAESARTNRGPVPVGEEVARLIPFVEGFADAVCGALPADTEQVYPPLLSLNTWRPEVAGAVLPHGGDILNDIGGLPDGRNAALCARHGAALVVMHTVGKPKEPHTSQRYGDVLAALEAFFAERIARAAEAGLAPASVILDPGIDFAKQRDDNLLIYRHLGRLARFRRPILVPVSRKTVVGEVLGLPDPCDRDAGTIACLTAAALRGGHLFRVHNVRAASQALKVLWAAGVGR